MNFDRAFRFLGSALPSSVFPNRSLRLAAAMAVTTVALAVAATAQAAEPTYDLRAAAAAGSEQQVKAVVEVAGDLKLNADGKEVQRLPLTVAAEMHFSERMLPAAKANLLHTVRHYHTATATIRIQGNETTQTLRDDRRLIAAQISGDKATLFSPLGPLTREELELIDIPGTSIALGSLLPGKSVAVGGTWKLSDAVVTRLVNLDAVTQQDIQCKLDEVKEGIAIIAASGKISGDVGGISSDIELQAKLNFDLKSRCVTWLAMALKEDRAIGHAQPGYQTTARIRLVAAPAGTPGITAAAPQPTDKQLSGLGLEAGPGSTLLELSTAKGGYELHHDRRWHVMTDHFDVAVMRLVDRGDLVAQCNLSKLPALPKGQQLTLEGFQQDVKKSLGKSFGQFVEAGEDKNESGIRILRATVSGFASELPIHWMYYHLSDDRGHRASLVFTLEAKLVERYAQLDREVISGFRFLDLPAEPEPTPAGGQAAASGPSLK